MRFLGLFEDGPSFRCLRNLLCGSIFYETAFYSVEKEGMLVNDECSSWYNRVGDFFSIDLG